MPEHPDPETELMLRVKRGDLVAFEQLVVRFQQPVMNLIYRTLPDSTEAEDLAQAVFVQVYKSADRYEPRAKFSTWLFTIARNLCLNEIRRRARHPAESMEGRAGSDPAESPALQIADPKAGSAGEEVMKREFQDLLERCLAELPEVQRTALVLYQQEEMSYEEISQLLRCSLSATKSLIFRARETLKKRLKPYLSEGTFAPGKEEQL